ncbi:membrane protein [Acrocarpospora pleiomorpha]|uniref:Membrane protein n=1 Tax=Acrocarpospora pleiomorpha TaxID=90975 RepID=A0A5M3XQ41_9ACTN|nr:amidohydrolase family protein [Acrocarpospora pleiomorpha]GES21293.1 membrane protein [Acrocarpospora pleiomorpha]
MTLVDAHVHLFSRTLPLAAGAWTRPEGDLTAEAFLPMMDAHGVSHAVISAMSLLGDQNEYTLAALRAHPRLRGTVHVEPGTELADLAGLIGVVGVRFQWRRRTDLPDLREPGYRTLLRQIAELDWHVELNIESARLPPVLDSLLAAGIKVVVDHFGDPHPETGYANPGGAALLRGLATGQVWVKLSAGYRFGVSPARLAGYAATLLSATGPERLFWGSDAPFVGARRPLTYQDAVNSFATTVPDPALREQITRTSLAFYFRSASRP